jgi:hypothetical protein
MFAFAYVQSWIWRQVARKHRTAGHYITRWYCSCCVKFRMQTGNDYSEVLWLGVCVKFTFSPCGLLPVWRCVWEFQLSSPSRPIYGLHVKPPGTDKNSAVYIPEKLSVWHFCSHSLVNFVYFFFSEKRRINRMITDISLSAHNPV